MWGTRGRVMGEGVMCGGLCLVMGEGVMCGGL